MLPDCRNVRPVGRLALYIHLPGAPEQVEVVDVDAAQRCLQRREHVADRKARGPGPSHGRYPGRCSVSWGVKVLNTRARLGFCRWRWPATRSARRPSQPVRGPSRFCNWYSNPPPVLERPMIGGKLNGKDRPPNGCRPLHTAENPANQRLHLVRCSRAFRKGLHPHDDEGRIGLVAAIQQREADDRQDILDLRDRPWHHGFDPLRPPPRVRVTLAPSGSCTAVKNAPWSSSGQEPRRRNDGASSHRLPPKHSAKTSRTATTREPQQQPATMPGIAIADPLSIRRPIQSEDPTLRGPLCRRKTAHKAGERVSALMAEISMTETEIVTANCRNNVARDPRNEGDRHEHGQQHERDCDDRPGDLPPSPFSWHHAGD